MSFSSNVHTLPSANTYARAVLVWERASIPRNKTKWPDGERPLDDSRKTHYAVIKDGAKVVFKLHDTNIVEWHGPTSCTINAGYNSITTRMFAARYMPAGISVHNMKENGHVLTYKTDDGTEHKIIANATRFELVGQHWVPAPGQATRKPKRKVLDKDRVAAVNVALKPMLDWVRAIWAVSGNDGTHPWVGMEHAYEELVPLDFHAIHAGNPEVWEPVVRRLLHTRDVWQSSRNQRFYTATVVEEVIKRLRSKAYKEAKCTISIDYDAPIPKRNKNREVVLG